jgi:hypothetical protein
MRRAVGSDAAALSQTSGPGSVVAGHDTGA